MTMRRWITRVAVTALVLLPLAPLARGDGAATSAAPALAVTLGPGSTLWLEGTSTLHDFESRSSAVVITLTADAASTHPADAAALSALVKTSGVHDVRVTVPVRSLRSGKDGLDKNLWKDLQADAHPSITFHLASYAVKSLDPGDSLAIHAEGTLEICGHSRPIQLDARAWRDPAGLWLAGSEPLLMSEYGIHPPTMMLGTLKVADRITVHYRLLLAPNADAAAGPATGEEGGKR